MTDELDRAKMELAWASDMMRALLAELQLHSGDPWGVFAAAVRNGCPADYVPQGLP